MNGTAKPFALWCFVVLQSPVVVHAQLGPERWEAMCIYFDRQYVDQTVTDAYSPITFEQLEEKLAAVASRRQSVPSVQRGVEEATYVAALVDGRIVSEQSVWRMRGDAGRLADYANLGKISFSAMRARSEQEGQRQLVDVDRYLATGELVVPDDPAYQEIVFGFTAMESRPSSRQFDMQLPAAPIARMFLAVPAGTQVYSDKATAELVSVSDVPFIGDVSDYSTFGQDGVSWWLLTCSGLETFSVKVEQTVVAVQGVPNVLVSRGKLNYVVDSAQAELVAEFELAPSSVDSPVRMAIDANLKILELNIGSTTVNWHTLLAATTEEAGNQSGQTLLELDANLRECGGKTLAVRAVAQHRAEEPIALPSVRLDGGYCVSGATRLLCQPGILISNVTSTANIPDSSAKDSSQDRSIAWMGNAPPLTIELVAATRQWQVDSLTRFAIQPEWLSATCRARVTIADPKTNLLTFRIDRNWFVDSVRILGDSSSRLRTNLRQTQGTQRWNVDVTWDDNPVDVQFDIEVAAHSPRNTRAERLSLRPSSLLTLADAVQNDHLVIEPSGQYRVEITRSLLSRQVQPIDLPTWQRDELGNNPEGAWIFARQEGNAPPVRLVAYRGTFVANIVSVAQLKASPESDAAAVPQGNAREIEKQAVSENGDSSWEVVSNIECQPISGAVGSVSCVLPSSLDPGDVKWSLQVGDSELNSQPVAVEAVARSTGDARLIEIVLPVPTTQSFTLQARVLARETDSQIELPVVAVPNAIGGSSTILLPPELSLRASNSGIQVLSDISGSNDSRFDELLAGLSELQRSQFVVARVDAAASHLLPATRITASSVQKVWVQEQRIEHRALAGAELEHTVQWTVQSGRTGILKVNVPDGWQLRSLEVAGEPDDTVVESGELAINVPSNATSDVRAVFASVADRGHWMRRLELQQPIVKAPVVSTRRVLLIQPSYTTLDRWAVMGRGETLMDRILPRRLWGMLTPRDTHSEAASWAVLELADVGDKMSDGLAVGAEPNFERVEITILTRTALAAFSIAIVLGCMGILRFCMPPAFGYWFSLCLLAMVAVLLVPASLLTVAQLGLLSTGCAFCLRLMHPIFHYRKNSELGTGGPRSRSMRSILGMLFVVLVPCSVVKGQASGRGIEQQTGIKTYGLLIPTIETEDGVEVAGSYAYVPKELLELLKQSTEGADSVQLPHVTSADYQIRLRSNALTGITRATDFRLQLDATFPLVTSEIVLPFEDPKVVLTGALIAGQSVAPGGRVIQEAGQIVVRPGMVGEVDIQLQFADLIPVEEKGRLSLEVGIPPLPIATLRVVTDGQQEFDIQSIGPIQKSMASTLARIGQLDALKVSWVDYARIGAVPPQPLKLQAHTWLHAGRGTLVASSRLLLNGPLPASGEVSVVLDSGWVPVGDQWGNARVIDRSLVAPGTRVSYQLQCSPEREDPNRCAISLLLVPKNLERATTLRAPFLSLQGSSQPERVFFWSADPSSDWRPEDLAFWQPSNAAEFDGWDSLALGKSEPVAFKATPDAGTPSARRQAAARKLEVTVTEETQLHIGESESHVDYVVQFDVAKERGLFSLQIPSGCAVRGVQIDGVEVDTYHVGAGVGGNVLVIDSPAVSVTSIAVQAETRTRQGVLTNMPRITLLGVEASSSRYYVFRGAGLDCELESTPGLSFSPFDVPASRLLQELESTVAAVELGSDYRNVVQLPSKYRAKRRSAGGRLQTLQKIARTEDGWQETLYCVWDGLQSPLDIVCVEIPARLRDLIDLGSLSRRYVPTGDPDTLSLCILPPLPESSRVIIAMRFPISTAASNQTLGLENIKVLDHDEAGSFIALPSEFRTSGSAEPTAVRWTKVGREIPSSGLVDLLGQGPWKVYQTLGRQTQASWLASDSVQSGRVLRERVEFTGIDSQGLRALVSYWIDPAGQTTFSAEIPRGCQLLGVRSGERIVDWHFSDSGNGDARKVQVLLQPNYLPTHLSMILQFDLLDLEAIKVTLPEVSMDRAGQVIDLANSLAGYVVEEQKATNERTSTRAQQWADILASAVPTLSDLAEDEVIDWLQAWHPRALGIPLNAVVKLSASTQDVDPTIRNVTAAECWLAIGEQLGSSLPGQMDQPDPVAAGVGNELRASLSDSRTLVLRRVQMPTNRLSRFGAAGLLLVILVLVLVLRLRIGNAYVAVLAHNPWLYWMQLAALLLVILPVIWPATIVCVLATSNAAAQWVDHWKRRRAGLQTR